MKLLKRMAHRHPPLFVHVHFEAIQLAQMIAKDRALPGPGAPLYDYRNRFIFTDLVGQHNADWHCSTERRMSGRYSFPDGHWRSAEGPSCVPKDPRILMTVTVSPGPVHSFRVHAGHDLTGTVDRNDPAVTSHLCQLIDRRVRCRLQ
jgi:hypothetical protein